MDIDYTVRACLQTRLYQEIVVRQVRLVERPDYIVGEVLPRDSYIESDEVSPKKCPKTYVNGKRSSSRP